MGHRLLPPTNFLLLVLPPCTRVSMSITTTIRPLLLVDLHIHLTTNTTTMDVHLRLLTTIMLLRLIIPTLTLMHTWVCLRIRWLTILISA